MTHIGCYICKKFKGVGEIQTVYDKNVCIDCIDEYHRHSRISLLYHREIERDKLNSKRECDK